MHLFSTQITRSHVALLSFLALGAVSVLRRYFRGTMNSAVRDMTGKIVVVTGGSLGIGKATVEGLCNQNATVIIGARNAANAQQVISQVKANKPTAQIFYFSLDLSSKNSIYEFAQSIIRHFEKVDILINNAGIMQSTPKTNQDNVEMTMATNHLGHFYLTNLLWPLLVRSADARVINVSSKANKRAKTLWTPDFSPRDPFNGFQNYSLTKLANILFTLEMQRKCTQTGLPVTCYSLHPGVVRTEIFNGLSKGFRFLLYLLYPLIYLLSKSCHEGAQTSLFLAMQTKQKLQPGGYYADCQVDKPNKLCENQQLWIQLWQASQAKLNARFLIRHNAN